jgi:hypothetical protein
MAWYVADKSTEGATGGRQADLSHPRLEQLAIKDDVERRYPGIVVLNICVNDQGGGADRKAGFFGNVNLQIDRVADMLEALPAFADGVRSCHLSRWSIPPWAASYIAFYRAPLSTLPS